ncbi:MAG: adenylosuccinate synthetase, partial [Dolichospermum sp.]
LPTHRLLDKASELAKGDKKIGSTLKGIGPTYMDKTGRNGLRIGDIENGLRHKYEILLNKHKQILDSNRASDLYQSDEFIEDQLKWFESITYLKNFEFIDSEYLINKALKE